MMPTNFTAVKFSPSFFKIQKVMMNEDGNN